MIDWTVNLLSEITGQDRRTVKKRLAAAGIHPIKSKKNGHCYDGSKALAVLYGGDGGHSTLDERKERARKYHEEADNLELKNHQLRGEWIPLEDAEAFWGSARQVIRERLLSLPSKLQSQFHPGLTGDDMRKLAQAEVDDCLMQLAKTPEFAEDKNGHGP